MRESAVKAGEKLIDFDVVDEAVIFAELLEVFVPALEALHENT